MCVCRIASFIIAIRLGKDSKGGFLTVRELVHMSQMNGLPTLTAPQALALLNKASVVCWWKGGSFVYFVSQAVYRHSLCAVAVQFDGDWTGGLNFDEFSKMLEHVQTKGAEGV